MNFLRNCRLRSNAAAKASVLLAFALSAFTITAADRGLGAVDFRYSLPWWQTAICLPDDPDKVLVGKEGQLLLDFGEGGVRNFGICLQPQFEGDSRWLNQRTLSARAPIVQTRTVADGVELLQETFVIPISDKTLQTRSPLVRTDGNERLKNWARPEIPCARVFTGVEVAYNGKPIEFELEVKRGASVTAVFGLCEAWHKVAGKRPLILGAEGAESRTVDPVRDFGPNQPGLYKLTAQDTNRDGRIRLRVATPEGAEDHNAILNALWVFEGTSPADSEIIRRGASPAALAVYPGNIVPERRIITLLTLKNGGSSSRTIQPSIKILSVGPVTVRPEDSSLLAGEDTKVSSSEKLELRAAEGGGGWVATFPKMFLNPGETRQAAITVDRHARASAPAVTPAQGNRLRDAAYQWWEHADLPFSTIQVPDPGIQALLESCVRNIWQAREIKNGRPAFHVGPTVYRGLWVVDGSFLLESAALLGRGKDARAGVEYLLSFQKEDGSFEILKRFWKENGIVLWAVTRHAALTQDRQWLRSKWPDLRRVVGAIARLRVEASKDPASLNFGLLPGGEVDGGISNATAPEFSNTYWCLAGLKAGVESARWLGEDADAAAWQAEYDTFHTALTSAMARDTRKDNAGNAYVPTMMDNARNLPPQKGQWAFCHGVYPGQIFEPADPLALSQAAMLRSTKTEGMVFDTGWMKDGIWTYFASFYAHAVLWQGQSREASEVLYDFAQHASPTRVWREEQKPVGKGVEEVGDMPHNWASAEFIRLTAHLLELDRGRELHLLEGFPSEWARPGMLTRLEGVATPFGPLHLELRIAADGKSARLKVRELKGSRPERIVVHLDGLTGTKAILSLPTNADVDRNIPL